MQQQRLFCIMGWLRLVGSLKLWVSFAKKPYKRDCIMQKQTCNFKEPTKRSHRMFFMSCDVVLEAVWMSSHTHPNTNTQIYLYIYAYLYTYIHKFMKPKHTRKHIVSYIFIFHVVCMLSETTINKTLTHIYVCVYIYVHI